MNTDKRLLIGGKFIRELVSWSSLVNRFILSSHGKVCLCTKFQFDIGSRARNGCSSRKKCTRIRVRAFVVHINRIKNDLFSWKLKINWIIDATFLSKVTRAWPQQWTTSHKQYTTSFINASISYHHHLVYETCNAKFCISYVCLLGVACCVCTLSLTFLLTPMFIHHA